MSSLNCSIEPLKQGDFSRYDQDQNGKLHKAELEQSGKLKEFIDRFVLTGSREILDRYLSDHNTLDSALKDAIRDVLWQIKDNPAEYADCLTDVDQKRVDLWLKREFSSGWLKLDVFTQPKYTFNHTVVGIDIPVESRVFLQEIDVTSHQFQLPAGFNLGGSVTRGKLSFDGGLPVSLGYFNGTSQTAVDFYDADHVLLSHDDLSDKTNSFHWKTKPYATLSTRDSKFSLTLGGQVENHVRPLPNKIRDRYNAGGKLRLRPFKVPLYLEMSGIYKNEQYAEPNVEGQQRRKEQTGKADAELGGQLGQKIGLSTAYSFERTDKTGAFDHSLVTNHNIDGRAQFELPQNVFLRASANALFSKTAYDYTYGIDAIDNDEKKVDGSLGLTTEPLPNVTLTVSGSLGWDGFQGSLNGGLFTNRQWLELLWTPSSLTVGLYLDRRDERGNLVTATEEEVSCSNETYIANPWIQYSLRDSLEAYVRGYFHVNDNECYQRDKSLSIVSVSTAVSVRVVNKEAAQLWLGGEVAYSRYREENTFVPGIDVSDDQVTTGLNLELRGLKLAGQK